MLNAYTYELLRLNKIKEAIAIFELTVQSFPESFMLYNSLGEAYAKNGDKKLAIKSYEKSLQLNPNNNNAKKRIKEYMKKNPS